MSAVWRSGAGASGAWVRLNLGARSFWVGLGVVGCCLAVSIGGARTARAARVAAPAQRQIVAYASFADEQFINNNDDESRGDVNNPFGTHSTTAAAIVEEHADGPFPGDEAVYLFTLYSSADLGKKTGSAVLTCQYYFNRNAFCDASFSINGGTLIGAGALNFDATHYAIAITGGYGTLSDLRGDVEETPSVKHAERLAFVLD